MVAIVGELGMEGLWKGWWFAMISMKKLLSNNGNVHVCFAYL